MMNHCQQRFVLSFWLIILVLLKLSSCQSINADNKNTSKEDSIVTVQVELMVSYLNKGTPEVAFKELRQALKKKPNNSELNNLMGLTQLALRNPRKAIQFFHRSHKSKKNIAVALNLSSAYLQAGQLRKAANILYSIRKREDFDSYLFPERIFHNLGLIHEKLNAPSKAEGYYLAALGENPSFYQTLIRLGKFYRHQSDMKKSFRYLKKSRKTCKKCWEPTRLLSAAYLQYQQPKYAKKVLISFLRQEHIPKAHRRHAQKMLKQAHHRIQSPRTQKGSLVSGPQSPSWQ